MPSRYGSDPELAALLERLGAQFDELRKLVAIDDMRDVLRARVQKVTVAQVNSRYL